MKGQKVFAPPLPMHHGDWRARQRNEGHERSGGYKKEGAFSFLTCPRCPRHVPAQSPLIAMQAARPPAQHWRGLHRHGGPLSPLSPLDRRSWPGFSGKVSACAFKLGRIGAIAHRSTLDPPALRALVQRAAHRAKEVPPRHLPRHRNGLRPKAAEQHSTSENARIDRACRLRRQYRQATRADDS